MGLKTKEKLRVRGCRLSDRQWWLLEAAADDENRRKNRVTGTTPSDVIRAAIDKFFEHPKG